MIESERKKVIVLGGAHQTPNGMTVYDLRDLVKKYWKDKHNDND